MDEKGAIPDSFGAISHFANIVLARRYGVSTMTITRWRKRLGLKARAPVPPDFTEWGPGKTFAEIKARYGVGPKVVERWRAESGVRGYDGKVDGWIGRPVAPVPADFAARVHLHSDRELARQYGCDYKTVRRWRRETGIERSTRAKKAGAQLPIQAPGSPGKTRSQSLSHVRLVPGQVVLPMFRNSIPPVQGGREQEAAQFLRRHYPCVYRCTERGGADQKGSHWRCGNAVLTAADLIERAVSKGWDEHAWRRVA